MTEINCSNCRWPALVRLHNQGLAEMDENIGLMTNVVNLSRTALISEPEKAQIEQVLATLEELRLINSRVSFCPVAEMAHGYPDLENCTIPLWFERSST